jgi:serine/threonine protein kinase
VASALDAAHAAGLVHRDVKPANMLVDARAGRPDHVYLSDFGLSKGCAVGARADRDRAGQFLGTPDYMAPEQIEGRPVDGRTISTRWRARRSSCWPACRRSRVIRHGGDLRAPVGAAAVG